MMHFCGFTERQALFEVPFVRGLQYIHAALLSQGAHCVIPGQLSNEITGLFDQAEELSKMIKSGILPDYE